jgi:hypothetical protein
LACKVQVDADPITVCVNEAEGSAVEEAHTLDTNQR